MRASSLPVFLSRRKTGLFKQALRKTFPWKKEKASNHMYKVNVHSQKITLVSQRL